MEKTLKLEITIDQLMYIDLALSDLRQAIAKNLDKYRSIDTDWTNKQEQAIKDILQLQASYRKQLL